MPEEAVMLRANAPEPPRARRPEPPGPRRAVVGWLVAEREGDADVAPLVRGAPEPQNEFVSPVRHLGHFRPREPVQDLATTENCEEVRLSSRVRTLRPWLLTNFRHTSCPDLTIRVL